MRKFKKIIFMFGDSVTKKYQYFFLFLVGAVILVLEIGGSRILAPFFGSTIFVWSALITVTMGFLSLGYFVGGYLVDIYTRRALYYYVNFFGAFFALFLIKLNRILLVFSDGFGFMYGPLVAGVLLFALPLFFYSMSGPVLIRLNSKNIESSGNVSGRIFAVSTIGSLFGALLAGYYFIPNFSLSAVMINSNLIIMIFSILGLFLVKDHIYRIIIFALVLILIYFVPVINIENNEDLKIIHKEASFYADLKVARLKYVDLLLMDGVAQSVFSHNTDQSFAYEALQINKHLSEYPDNADILVLGFGVGSVKGVFDSRFAVDYVELDPKMIKLAKEYFNYDLDKNDTMYIADARQFLRKNNKKYDVIFVDLYHSGVIPVHTHTQEALMLMRSRLKDDGILFSNMLGDPDSALIQSLALTTESVFPYTQYSVTQEGFTNVLAYAANNEMKLDFNGRHKEIIIKKDKAEIISDDKNSLDMLSSERMGEFLKKTKEVLGYQAMFSI